jgi:5-methyltetrahydrofolate--homocysteine methyltransferase
VADYEKLASSVINGDVEKVIELTKSLAEEGYEPLDIINKGLVSGMNVVGTLFKEGEMFVPEVLMAASAMSSGVEIVKPLLTDGDMPSAGKIVLGTVKGDLHDIGKNLLSMTLESAGFDVLNLGVDISPEEFVEAIKEHEPDILAMSALLTTTMLVMKDTIELLKEKGLREKVKVVIGGASVSQIFADEIGADGFAPDVTTAVELCKNLINCAS